MGMFDSIDVPRPVCPYCENRIGDIQTKALAKMLTRYRIGSKVPIDHNFEAHAVCGQHWIEFLCFVTDEVLVGVVPVNVTTLDGHGQLWNFGEPFGVPIRALR